MPGVAITPGTPELELCALGWLPGVAARVRCMVESRFVRPPDCAVFAQRMTRSYIVTGPRRRLRIRRTLVGTRTRNLSGQGADLVAKEWAWRSHVRRPGSA